VVLYQRDRIVEPCLERVGQLLRQLRANDVEADANAVRFCNLVMQLPRQPLALDLFRFREPGGQGPDLDVLLPDLFEQAGVAHGHRRLIGKGRKKEEIFLAEHLCAPNTFQRQAADGLSAVAQGRHHGRPAGLHLFG
jgi:hypothetical protein